MDNLSNPHRHSECDIEDNGVHGGGERKFHHVSRSD